MLTPEQIRAFYNFWEELDYYGSWYGLWRMQHKFQTHNKRFHAINKKIPRLNYRKLKKTAIKLALLHIYASALEYLRPEKVLSKTNTLNAYPVGGEFVIDIDAYMNFHKHRHKKESA
jgi:DNA primase catalytic subunit